MKKFIFSFLFFSILIVTACSSNKIIYTGNVKVDQYSEYGDRVISTYYLDTSKGDSGYENSSWVVLTFYRSNKNLTLPRDRCSVTWR